MSDRAVCGAHTPIQKLTMQRHMPVYICVHMQAIMISPLRRFGGMPSGSSLDGPLFPVDVRVTYTLDSQYNCNGKRTSCLWHGSERVADRCLLSLYRPPEAADVRTQTTRSS